MSLVRGSSEGLPGWEAMPGEPRVPRMDVGPDTDVGELLRENSRLRRRLGEIETMVNRHSIVAVTDRRGVITDVNQRFVEISKYSREELIGQTHRIVNSGRHPKEFFREMWRTIGRGQIWQGEICNRDKEGGEYWVTTTIIPLLDAEGRPERYVAIRNDITRLHQVERELWKLAYFDSRTQLPSRPSVLEALEECTKRSDELWCAFASLSIDDLSPVNDAFGYAKGDALLLYAARCLESLGEPVRLVGHIDTGMFGLLLPALGEEREAAEALAVETIERALDVICGPAVLGVGVEIETTATAGLRMYRGREAGLDADEVMKSADIARKRAVAQKKQFCVFDPQMLEEAKTQVDLLLDLRRGIVEGALCLYLQPIVDAERRIISYEGLVRWMDEKRGLVPPQEFIPLAERTGLIVDIGVWVLGEACRVLAAWAKQPATKDLKLSINVSEHQLRRADFAETVRCALRRHGASADRLRIEVTESTLQSDIAQAISTLRALHADDIQVSLDDFGTGYSSLSYLRQLPVHQLKIDRSFVQDIAVDPVDAELVRGIVELAHYMGLSVVAEGVEDEAQFAALKRFAIDAYQGYLFGRPEPHGI